MESIETVLFTQEEKGNIWCYDEFWAG